MIRRLFLGLALLAALIVPAGALTNSQRVAILNPPPPVLDCQFGAGTVVASGVVNAGPKCPSITFTRATTAWYFNASGLLTSAASGFARIDYGLGGSAPLGLLIEQASTNLGLYSRDMTQSGSWTLGATMTVAKTATGIDGTANSASLLTAGLTSATDTILQSITYASSATTYSAYVQRVTGTGTVNITLNGGTNWTALTSSNCIGPGNVASGLVTNNYVRCTIEATVANPSVGFQIVTSGDQVNVDLNQVEAIAFATSPIITTSSTVTRNADIVTIATSGIPGWKSDTGAIIAKYLNGGTNSYGTIFGDQTSDPLFQFANSTNYKLDSYLSGDQIWAGGTYPFSAVSTVGVSYGPAGLFNTANGGTPTAFTYPAGTVSAITTAQLGNDPSSEPWGVGWFQRLKIFTQRQPSASSLQTLTAPGAN